MQTLLFIAAFIVAVTTAAPAGNGTVVIVTPDGGLRGRYEKTVATFRGIPYAAPPVGNLRFRPPLRNAKWTGVRDALNFSAGCASHCSTDAFPRPSIMCTPVRSEDCLYLNVFTPTLQPNASLPVIMFIHGGNYVGGSGGVPLYDGTVLAMTANAVIVTINYRLGILGALYTGTGSIQGNYQTQDQREAMRWIQRNIASFGGNPSLVTISGQSAGAFSVATHLSSPRSWSLFQRAIIVSDPFSLLATNTFTAARLGQKVVERLGCPQAGTPMEECLRNVSADAILDIQHTTDFSPDPDQFLALMMQWVPVVDGNDLPMQPLVAMSTGQFSKVPVFFGTVRNESVQFIYDLSPKPMSSFDIFALTALVFGLDNATKIMGVYGPIPQSQANDARPWFSFLATDYIFYCVNRFIGYSISQHVPTYMWFFDRLPTMNKWVFNKTMPYCVNNVCHAEDLTYIFFPFSVVTLPPEAPKPTAAEKRLSLYIQTAWGNFARTGDVNGYKGLPLHWPRFNASSNTLVNLSTPVGTVHDYRGARCDFWDTIGYHRR